jgi:3-phosphoshikimate 1-carboxyvinyltransferase
VKGRADWQSPYPAAPPATRRPPAPEVLAPSSKSQTQRALVLAALAAGESRIRRPLLCDDSEHLSAALEGLGAVISRDLDGWSVVGTGGELRAPDEPLRCGEGGTTLRFLACLSALLPRGSRALWLIGTGRLRERPMRELADALLGLGVEVSIERPNDSLALRLQRTGELSGRIEVDASRSSQFLSGLLMTGPCLDRAATGGALQIEVTGEAVSRPYVDLTIDAMRRFGVDVERNRGAFVVPVATYQTCEIDIEGDWSGGAFLLAASWIAGLDASVPNLDPGSLQPDRAIAGFLAELARPRPHRFDLTDCPDLVAPLAAACVFGSAPSRIVGAAHARLKESDRVAVLASQLREAGAEVEERPDGLLIAPSGAKLRPAVLDPAGDHRMAMAFGLLSLRQPKIEVCDRGCVTKSYPGFWSDLERFRRTTTT